MVESFNYVFPFLNIPSKFEITAIWYIVDLILSGNKLTLFKECK